MRPHGRLRGRPQRGEGRWDAVSALSSRPFCLCEGRPGKPVVFIRRVQVHDPVVRSGQVRGPERSPCVRMAGGEAVTRGQRAAGKS